AVSNGQVIEVKIDSIDRENKRISLLPESSEPSEEPSGEDVSRYAKANSPAMGTFADLLQAKLREKKKK
ncbi:MAG: 30S ribosomal protein S1, partial [Syntrophobacteraceae bacterium]